MEKPKSFSVYVKTQCLSSSRWRSLSFDEHNHASPTQELQSYPAQEVSPASSRIPLATNVLRNHPSPTLSLPPHEHFLLIIRKAGCSRPYQRISLSLSHVREASIGRHHRQSYASPENLILKKIDCMHVVSIIWIHLVIKLRIAGNWNIKSWT